MEDVPSIKAAAYSLQSVYESCVLPVTQPHVTPSLKLEGAFHYEVPVLVMVKPPF